MISFLKYNLPSLVWAVIILWLSLTPATGFPKINIPNIDKAVHFSFYLILSILMFYGWLNQNTFKYLHRDYFLRITWLVCTYGLLIEILQENFTLTRHFELPDLVANVLGALTGSLISVKLFKNVKQS